MSDSMLMEIQKFADQVIRENSGANFKPEDVQLRYPDSTVTDIVYSLSRLTHAPVKHILENFGRFVADEMAEQPLRRAGLTALPAQTTLAVLETLGTAMDGSRTGETVPSAPEFHCHRTSIDEVMVEVERGRHWCAITKGFIAGLADHYGEQVEWCETSCLNEGDTACHLFVTVPALKSAA